MDIEESFTTRMESARAARDLPLLYEIVEDAVSGMMEIRPTELCGIISDIGRLKRLLEQSDTRGWKKSGKIGREDVILACRRAIRVLVGKCEEAGNSRGVDPPAPKKLTARRPAKIGKVRVF